MVDRPMVSSAVSGKAPAARPVEIEMESRACNNVQIQDRMTVSF